MNRLRKFQIVLATAGSAMLSALIPGCGPSVGGFCNKVCDCIGCSDPELEECIDTYDDARKAAQEKDCSAEYDDAFSCVNSELTCVDGKASADGCDTENEALAKCAGVTIGAGACESVCEKTAQCPNAEPIDCAASCAQLQADVAVTGCTDELDEYLACLDALPDACNLDGDTCPAEINAYSNCFITYCQANPNSDPCL